MPFLVVLLVFSWVTRLTPAVLESINMICYEVFMKPDLIAIIEEVGNATLCYIMVATGLWAALWKSWFQSISLTFIE